MDCVERQRSHAVASMHVNDLSCIGIENKIHCNLNIKLSYTSCVRNPFKMGNVPVIPVEES